VVQIIFVHGLGGNRRGTWKHPSKIRKAPFWPEWLQDEEGFERVKIGLFGYNSNIDFVRQKNQLGIPDFAIQLLKGLEQDMSFRQTSRKVIPQITSD
jgi:hypothetical protein